MGRKDLPYSSKGDLTTGPVKNHLIRLTIPMTWGLLAIISLQLADTYFISLLGTDKLAGISFTFPVTMIITHLTFGLNIAMSSVVSRLIGRKDMDDVKRVVLHGIMLAVLTSMVIAAICYMLLDPIFTLLGADEITMPIIRDYMPIWLLGSIFLSIPVNGNSAIRAGGDSFVPALIMTAMALVNVILDPILIFGLLGVPAMGVKGAAVATFIAYIVALVLGLYVLICKKKMIALDGLHLDKFADSVKRLVYIAIPAGITNIIQPATNAIIISLLAAYGGEAVAAFGVATRVEALAFLIVISLAVGMAPIIGQNWGAGIFTRVHETLNLAINFNFLWSFGVAVILGIFAHDIAGIFSSDPAVIHYAVMFFWTVPFSYAFGNLVYGWGSAFNAMGMPKRAFVMIVTKAFGLIIPAVIIGGWLYGVQGIFIGMACANVIAGSFFHILSWRVCLAREQAEEQPAV